MTTLSGSALDVPAEHSLEDAPGALRLDASDIHDYQIGEGVSTFTGKTRSSCVSGTLATPSTGYVTDVYIMLAETRDEFHESLGVEAEVSGSYGLAKASAKMKFAESFKTSSFSSWLVIRVTVKGPVIAFKGQPVMDQAARELLDQTNGPWKFMKAYGDRYVSKVLKGGEFVAVLQIDSSSESSKRELHAEWKASGGIGKLSLSTAGQIDKMTEKSHATNRLEFRCHVVGPTSLPAELTTAKVIDYALKFPDTITPEKSATIGVVLQDYHTLTAQRLEWPNYQAAKTLSAEVSKDIASLEVKSATARNIASRAISYGYGKAKETRATYTAIADLIDGDVRRLKTTIGNCLEAFFGDTEPSVPARPSAGEYATKGIPSPGNTVRVPKRIVENVQIVCRNASYLRLAARNGEYPEVASNNPQDSKQIWNLLFYRDNSNECVMHVEVDGKSYAIAGMPENNFALKMIPFTDNIDDSTGVWDIHGDLKGQVQIVLRRDGGRPLTINGGGGWKAGDAVLVYEWGNQPNQHWWIEPIG